MAVSVMVEQDGREASTNIMSICPTCATYTATVGRGRTNTNHNKNKSFFALFEAMPWDEGEMKPFLFVF